MMIRGASAQRWSLAVLAIAAAIGAWAATAGAAGHTSRIELIMVVTLAIASAERPDSHIGLAVVIVIVTGWMVEVDSGISIWSLLAAVALLVFHTSVSMMSVAPPALSVDSVVIGRWLRRAGIVTAATAAVWGLEELLSRRHASGNAVITAAALVAVIAAIAALRQRSVADR